MVAMTLRQRLARLEKASPRANVEAEVAAILRQRLADPALTQHRREMAALVLEANRCRMTA